MPDKPIIFSAPMIRALLDGRKTQTRRVLNPQPEQNSAGLWVYPPSTTKTTKRNWRGFCQTDEDGLASFILSTPHAPYAPGERLWVREAHKLIDRHCDYRADWPIGNMHLFKWRPSIHMPRWASRMTLGVTEVRVQRLQEITAEECTAEGVPFEADALAPYEWSVSRFADLWNTIHGPDAWDANPWVCALTFTVHRCNIDQMER